jgi:hypothetical protein
MPSFVPGDISTQKPSSNIMKTRKMNVRTLRSSSCSFEAVPQACLSICDNSSPKMTTPALFVPIVLDYRSRCTSYPSPNHAIRTPNPHGKTASRIHTSSTHSERSRLFRRGWLFPRWICCMGTGRLESRGTESQKRRSGGQGIKWDG